jgi:ADP-ribosyl-[dinitrogen reductase] hydrolase
MNQIPAGTRGGCIGLTSRPGKPSSATSGPAGRELLERDVRKIKSWRSQALVSAIEDEELKALDIQDVGACATRMGMWWFRAPLKESTEPDDRFWQAWLRAAPPLLDILRHGQRIAVHSSNGYGRSGLVACCLLLELGLQPEDALTTVRAVEPNALDVPIHERFIRRYLPRFPEHTRLKGG